MTDVDVELARSAQLVARARRQQAVEALQKATVELRRVLAARWMLVFAVVATGIAGVGATPWFFAATVLLAAVLVYNVRSVEPGYRLALAERQLDYQHAHADWETAHHRMLDVEAENPTPKNDTTKTREEL